MRTGWYFMLSLCLCAAFPNSAGAHLLEHSFSAAYYFPDGSTPYAFATFIPDGFIPRPGPESIGEVENATSLLTKFSENSVTIFFYSLPSNPSWAMTPINGVGFTPTSGGSLQIASVAVNAATTLGGFDASRIAFNDHDIGLNWSNLSYLDRDGLVVQFAFIKENRLQPSLSVGELDMWTLAAGAILIAWVRLRRRLRL